MMFLALGTMVSLTGISSCKKPPVMDPSFRQRFSMPMHEPPMDLTIDPTMEASSNISVRGAPGHTPIPGTLLLLGSGLAGMAFIGWRKRAKR